MNSVIRLRLRGCWAEAAAQLAPAAENDFAAALERAEVLVEAAMFTVDGWGAAEAAVVAAEALADADEHRGQARVTRGYFAYACLLRDDRATAATAADHFAAADGLLAPDSPHRPTLDFRRGLVAQNLAHDTAAARTWFARAHAAAGDDELLLSYTWRHLAAVDAADGDTVTARHGYTESLRLRERCGFLVGLAPALYALASVMDEPDSARLRGEAARLVRAFGGIPAWLPADST